MRGLRQRVRAWRRRAPRRFWLSIGILALAGGSVLSKNYPLERQLAYEPCQTNYGQTVAGWDGSGDSFWNERNFRYESKLFKIEAIAPVDWFGNIWEDPPSRISTLDCQPELEGYVDTAHSSYQWFGSRAAAMRLGIPDLGDVNRHGQTDIPGAKTNPTKVVSPPIYTHHQHRAAAWVDDGAQASLLTTQRSQKLLWCQGNPQPFNPEPACGDVTNTDGQSINGAGYLFVKDNCPGGEDIDCSRVAEWYQRYQKLDITKLAERNQRGEIEPFYLRMDAVSTHANRLGAWMILTFKYPRLTELSHQVNLNKTSFLPGETIVATAKFSKLGPTLNNLVISVGLNDQPLQRQNEFETSTGDLEVVNKGKTASSRAAFKVNQNAAPGQCYNLSFNFEATSAVENAGTNSSKIPPITKRYCVASPVRATYTYEVTSRGKIESNLDEFATLAAQTLANRQSWTAAKVSFRRVASGGDFTLALTAPDQMPSFSSGCDAIYSCQSGRFVIINDERWRQATPSWRKGGHSLRDYRHMAINHEVGHWLGFGHLNCPKAGAPAPVMQQQSVNLQGCRHNPWPTPAELTALEKQLQ